MGLKWIENEKLCEKSLWGKSQVGVQWLKFDECKNVGAKVLTLRLRDHASLNNIKIDEQHQRRLIVSAETRTLICYTLQGDKSPHQNLCETSKIKMNWSEK